MKKSEFDGPENWGALLKQIQDPQFQAILADDPALHINRAQARKLGEHSGEELRAKVDARRKELQDFRDFTLGKWLHERMGEFFPAGLRDRTVAQGPKEANALGWFWGVENKPMFAAGEDGKPKMYPSSKIFLGFQPHKKRFFFFGERINLDKPDIKAQQVFHWSQENN